MRRIALTAIAVTPLLAACETSMRLPSMSNSPFGTSERVSPQRPQAERPPQIDTAPSAKVESSPLAPPPGSSVGTAADPSGGAAQQLQSPDQASGTTPGAASSSTTPQQQAQQSASAESPRPQPQESAAPTRSSVTGNWQAREASGANCRVTLSSSPKLDLYSAATSGCQSRDLQRVTAWELRGEEVYLYEPGGAVAARLKAGGRAMSGTLAKTGAPVSLSK